MSERDGKKGARRRRIALVAGVPATLFVVLLLVMVAALWTAAGSAVPTSSSGVRTAAVVPTVANPNLYINRSQINGGTYVAEYVSLNNSTSLTALPYGGSSAHGCRYVTVLNTTQAARPASVFHAVTYANMTTGNDSGTLKAGVGTLSFYACSGTPIWINYIYWTYALYNFASTKLGGTQASGTIAAKGLANLTLVYVTPTGYAGAKKTYLNTTYPFDANHQVQIKVPTNESFSVSVPLAVTGPTTCDPTGQICSYPQWTFVSATNATATNTTGTLTFAQPLKAAYNNWTAGYAWNNVTANTYWGGGFLYTQSILSTIFITNWIWWVLAIVVVIFVAAIWRSRSGPRH